MLKIVRLRRAFGRRMYLPTSYGYNWGRDEKKKKWKKSKKWGRKRRTNFLDVSTDKRFSTFPCVKSQRFLELVRMARTKQSGGAKLFIVPTFFRILNIEKVNGEMNWVENYSELCFSFAVPPQDDVCKYFLDFYFWFPLSSNSNGKENRMLDRGLPNRIWIGGEGGGEAKEMWIW